MKNCLTVVSAINRLLESEVSETARDRLARSQDAVKRMLALVQEDLIAPHDLEPERPRFVATEDLLRVVIARVEDRAEAGRVDLVVRPGPGGVEGHLGDLTEALVNLVLNAIEATPAGGSVFIATRALPDGTQVWAIRDTAPGIPENVRERLGTPFVTGRSGGSGVGFAVARQTLERHGAQLHVRSVRGSGTLISMRVRGFEEAGDGNGGAF